MTLIPSLCAHENPVVAYRARRLLWRKKDGTLIVPEWGGPVDKIHYPIRFYDVLSALLVMAEMGLARDRRCADALDLLERKRLMCSTRRGDREGEPYGDATSVTRGFVLAGLEQSGLGP